MWTIWEWVSLFEAVDGIHILIQMVVGLVLHKMLIASQQQEAMGHPGANTIFQAYFNNNNIDIICSPNNIA